MVSLLNKEHIIKCEEIERAVKNFCLESDTEYKACSDLLGLFNQTMENIGNIIVNHPINQFLWLETNSIGKVLGYILTHISKDVDNKACYYMTQAWLDPCYRNTSYSKQAISLLRQHAKDLLCKHIIVVSSRNTKAYLRFLGGKFAPYVTLLKEDI